MRTVFFQWAWRQLASHLKNRCLDSISGTLMVECIRAGRSLVCLAKSPARPMKPSAEPQLNVSSLRRDVHDLRMLCVFCDNYRVPSRKTVLYFRRCRHIYIYNQNDQLGHLSWHVDQLSRVNRLGPGMNVELELELDGKLSFTSSDHGVFQLRISILCWTFSLR